MKRNPIFLFLLLLAAVSCGGPEDGVYRLQLFTTNDVHGRYFDSLYVGDGTRQSLYAVTSTTWTLSPPMYTPGW